MTLRERIKRDLAREGTGAPSIPPVRKPRNSGLAKRDHELAVLKLTEDKRYSHTHSKERRPL